VSRLGDGHAEVLEGDAVGLRSAADVGVERVDGGHLLGGELEVEDVEVLGDAGGLVDFGIAPRPSRRCQRSIT
jgi:hypothetical protein